MSVAIIIERITEDKKKFEELKTSNRSFIYSDAKVIDEFSVELTIGDKWGEISKDGNVKLYEIDEGKIELSPNKSLIVEVGEFMTIPNNLYGIIMPKGHLLFNKGIYIASTKVEPGFEGKLALLLHNSSGRKQTLNKGHVIASTVFFCTERTLKVVDRGGRSDIKDYTSKRKPFFKVLSASLFKNYNDNPALFVGGLFRTIFTILTSSVVAALLTYYFLKS